MADETPKQIKLTDFGCKEQSLEFYTDLGNKFSQLDHYDRLRLIEIFMKNLFNTDTKLSPIVMRLMMEKLQEIEIKSATWKKMLGDTKISGLSCSKCGNNYPTMTMQMLCEGINGECPHDLVEIEFE